MNYLELTAENLITELNLDETYMGCDLISIPTAGASIEEISAIIQNSEADHVQSSNILRSRYIIIGNALCYFDKTNGTFQKLEVNLENITTIKNRFGIQDSSQTIIESLSLAALAELQSLTKHKHYRPVKTVNKKIRDWLVRFGQELTQNDLENHLIEILIRIRSCLITIQERYKTKIETDKANELEYLLLEYYHAFTSTHQHVPVGWHEQRLTEEINEGKEIAYLSTERAFLLLLHHFNTQKRLNRFIHTLQESPIVKAIGIFQIEEIGDYFSLRHRFDNRTQLSNRHPFGKTNEVILADAMSKYYLNWIKNVEMFAFFLERSQSHGYLHEDLDILLANPALTLEKSTFYETLKTLKNKETPMLSKNATAKKGGHLHLKKYFQNIRNTFIINVLDIILPQIKSFEDLNSLLVALSEYYTQTSTNDVFLIGLFRQLDDHNLFVYVQSIRHFFSIFSYFVSESQLSLLKKMRTASFGHAFSKKTMFISISEQFYRGNNQFHSQIQALLDCFPAECHPQIIQHIYNMILKEANHPELGFVRLETTIPIEAINQNFNHKEVLIRQYGGIGEENNLYDTSTLHYYNQLRKTVKRKIFNSKHIRGAFAFKFLQQETIEGEAPVNESVLLIIDTFGFADYFQEYSVMIIILNKKLFYAQKNNTSGYIECYEIPSDAESIGNQLKQCFTAMPPGDARCLVPNELRLLNQATGLCIRNIRSVDEFRAYQKEKDFNLKPIEEMEYITEYAEVFGAGETIYTSETADYFDEGEGIAHRFVEETTITQYRCDPIFTQKKSTFEDIDKELRPLLQNKHSREITISSYTLKILIEKQPSLGDFVNGTCLINEYSYENIDDRIHIAHLPRISFKTLSTNQNAFSTLIAWIVALEEVDIQEAEHFLIQSYLTDKTEFESTYPKACYKDTLMSNQYMVLFKKLNDSEPMASYTQNLSEKTKQPSLLEIAKAKTADRRANKATTQQRDKISIAALTKRNQEKQQRIAEERCAKAAEDMLAKNNSCSSEDIISTKPFPFI